MTKVLISGGTGSIGRLMADFLDQQGYEVCLLSRSEKKGGRYKTYRWNIDENYLDPEALDSCDYIIHLAGAGIADKAWTTHRKKEIIERGRALGVPFEKTNTSVSAVIPGKGTL